MTETKRNAMTFHGFLTNTNGHLRDVDKSTLGTGNDHLLDAVILLQVLLSILTRLVTLDHALEGFSDGHSTGLGL
jgi:hypothetical protein